MNLLKELAEQNEAEAAQNEAEARRLDEYGKELHEWHKNMLGFSKDLKRESLAIAVKAQRCRDQALRSRQIAEKQHSLAAGGDMSLGQIEALFSDGPKLVVNND